MKKKSKSLLALLLCVSMLFVMVTACSNTKDNGNSAQNTPDASQSNTADQADNTQTPADDAQEGRNIAICVNSLETIFYRDIVSYIESVMGPNDKLAVFDPSEDSATQITILEDCIVKGYDLIFTTCMDPVGMRTIFESAQKAEIPVIVYDFASEDPDLVATTIVYDDYQLGQLQAEGLAEALNYEGTIIRYHDTSMSGPAKRTAAFEETMAKYPNISVVASTEGPPMSDYSYPAIESMLTANPDADALWTMASAAGCAGCAVKMANNNDTLLIGTCGIDHETAGYIRDGVMYGCVGQFAEDIGSLMWMAAEKVFAGEADTLEAQYNVDAVWVTAETIDQYWAAE